jgi:hypothetical protein
LIPVVTLKHFPPMSRSLPILLILAFSASAQAANISVSGTITGTQVSMLNSAGITLPAGSQVRLGFFLNYTAALDSTLRSGNLNTLSTGDNRFIPFGETASPTGYGTASEATNDLKEVPVGSGNIRANVTYAGVNYIGNDNDVAAANTLTSGGVARGTKVVLDLSMVSTAPPIGSFLPRAPLTPRFNFSTWIPIVRSFTVVWAPCAQRCRSPNQPR